MKQPELERLAELYHAWIENKPPTTAGQYNEILPMHDFSGNPIRACAMVTWNPLRNQYEMEPVEKDSAGVTQLTFLDIPSENYPQFLEIWAEVGIDTFHRVLIDGQEPHKTRPTSLELMFMPTDPRSINRQ